MGKQLVIKGADFSANAICGSAEIYDIFTLSNMSWTSGGSGLNGRTSSTTRISTDVTDIIDFIAGKTTISIASKSGYDIVCWIGDSSTGSGTSATTWVWTNSVSCSLHQYVMIQIRNSNNSTIVSSGDLRDYVEITIS